MTPPRCFYPNCVLEEHETGEHKFGRPDKPWGELRQLQTFDAVLTAGGCVRCDYCAPDQTVIRHWSKPSAWRAVAFYADMLGFGWALCADCAREFTAKVAEVAKEEPETHLARKEEKPGQPMVTANSSAPVASFAVNPLAKVLKFAPRASSQKLKAGVS